MTTDGGGVTHKEFYGNLLHVRAEKLNSLLSAAVLAIHLLAVNLAAAGPLVCVVLQAQRRRGNSVAGEIGRQLALASLVALVAGMLLGLVLGVLAWIDPRQAYREALLRFPPGAYWNVVGESTFSLVCLGLYVLAWEKLERRPFTHGLLALLSSTNLLYHFPPLMGAIGALAAQPDLIVEDTVTRAAVRRLMLTPEILAKTTHVVLASFAVAGVVLILIARRMREAPPKHSSAGSSRRDQLDRFVVGGGRLALVPTLLQILVGMWLILQLPIVSRRGLMGDDLVATLLLGASFLATFGLLHALAAIALGDADSKNVNHAVLWMVLIVGLMSGTLSRARQLASFEVVRTPAGSLHQDVARNCSNLAPDPTT